MFKRNLVMALVMISLVAIPQQAAAFAIKPAQIIDTPPLVTQVHHKWRKRAIVGAIIAGALIGGAIAHNHRHRHGHYHHRHYSRSSNAHVHWCYHRYRSYRAYDNTFQPYRGGRRQCISPYY